MYGHQTAYMVTSDKKQKKMMKVVNTCLASKFIQMIGKTPS